MLLLRLHGRRRGMNCRWRDGLALRRGIHILPRFGSVCGNVRRPGLVGLLPGLGLNRLMWMRICRR